VSKDDLLAVTWFLAFEKSLSLGTEVALTAKYSLVTFDKFGKLEVLSFHYNSGLVSYWNSGNSLYIDNFL